jgi:hypothetical protein
MNESKGLRPGIAYIYDALRATCRYDNYQKMKFDINELTKTLHGNVITFENKLMKEV